MSVGALRSSSLVIVVAATFVIGSRLYERWNRKTSAVTRRVEFVVQNLPPGVETEALSAMDKLVVHLPMGWSYRYDGVLLDEERLLVALKRVLEVYPVLGGRFRNDKIVFEENNNGVAFEVVEYEAFWGELPDDNSLNEEWIEKGVTFPVEFYKVPTKDTPLMKVRLQKFHKENVSFLAVSVNHCLADSHGYVALMDLWSKLCENPAMEVPPPQLGIRLVSPRRVCSSKEELEERWLKNVNGNLVPFISWKESIRKFFFMMSFIYDVFVKHKPVEFLIRKNEVDKIKQTMKRDYLGPGEWVSDNDIVVGTILHTMVLSGLYGAPKRVSIVTNCRAPRVMDIPNNIFGNYVGNSSLDFSSENLPDRTLYETIKLFHDKLQTFLRERPESAYDMPDLLLNANALGCPIDVMNPRQMVSEAFGANSWRNYPWFSSATMENVEPSAFGVSYPPFARFNNLLQMPKRPNGDGMIYLAIPSEQPDLYENISFLERKEKKTN